MQDTITTVYCVCAEVLEALGVQDDGQSRYSHAEVMTVPLVAALFHQGNHALTRRFLHQHKYTRNTLSASRFCRRLARVPQSAWEMVFALLAQVFKAHNQGEVYAVDSYPVAVCANCRIKRCRLFKVEAHQELRGYQASKKQYFYGFKVHLLVTAKGHPVEFFLSQGSLHDLEGLKRLPLDLPAGATLSSVCSTARCPSTSTPSHLWGFSSNSKPLLLLMPSTGSWHREQLGLHNTSGLTA